MQTMQKQFKNQVKTMWKSNKKLCENQVWYLCVNNVKTMQKSSETMWTEALKISSPGLNVFFIKINLFPSGIDVFLCCS